MEKPAYKTNFSAPSGEEMRIVAGADADEPVVPIPPVVKPIEVKLANRLVAIDD